MDCGFFCLMLNYCKKKKKKVATVSRSDLSSVQCSLCDCSGLCAVDDDGLVVCKT